MKVAIIASTNGSVLKRCLLDPYVKSKVDVVISDRYCGAIEVAKSESIKTELFFTEDAEEFSNLITKKYAKNDYLLISFYTKLFKGKIIETFAGRLINFHPSILPSHKGKRGFESSYEARDEYLGSTVHLIDEYMDTGRIIIQSKFKADYKLEAKDLRHKIFLQQCKMLKQVIKWYDQDRIVIDKKVKILNSTSISKEFSPDIEEDLYG